MKYDCIEDKALDSYRKCKFDIIVKLIKTDLRFFLYENLAGHSSLLVEVHILSSNTKQQPERICLNFLDSAMNCLYLILELRYSLSL